MGTDNDVCLLNDGTTVEVHKSGSSRLWYDIGKLNIKKKVVDWSINRKLSDGYGITPNIAANQFGHVIVVFKSQNNQKLKFHAGNLTEKRDNVIWQAHSTFEQGENPSVAISNHSIVTVQISKSELWNRSGFFVKDKITKPTLNMIPRPMEANVDSSIIWSVNYGAVVSICHQKTGRFLQSNEQNYSTGSRRQHVILVDSKDSLDASTQWKIKPGDGIDKKKGPVKVGEMIRLEHVSTKRNLHSEINFKATIGNLQEVCCFGDNGEGNQMDNWLFQLPSKEETMQTKQVFKLMHICGKYLCSDGQLLENKLHCQVVCADKMENGSLFYINEINDK
jgi:hypothetical protein